MASSPDYIIIGGGTAGLVVASRLSENPSICVLILEAGPSRTDDPRVQNPATYQTLAGSELDWKLTTVPQTELKNRILDHPAGKLLGDSSAINGCIYLPPSPAVLDAWGSMGNAGWDWQSLKPYIQKTYTLHPPRLPSEDTVGSAPTCDTLPDGLIQVAYEPPANGADKTLVDAWVAAFEQHGYEHISDFLAEEKTVGTRAYTAAIDPTSGHRSSADAKHGALLAGRENVTVMTDATVERIPLEQTPNGSVRATGVEANVDCQLTTFKASREVILPAGVFHSPKLLELSGIGDATRLRELGITGLPVGLKPHPGTQGITPGIKAFAFVSLDDEAGQQLSTSTITTTPDGAAEGLRSSTIRSILQDSNESSAIIGVSIISESLAGLGIGLTFAFSRGSSHIQSKYPEASPRYDVGFLTNNLDLEILVRHVQQAIDFLASSTALAPFFHECQIPSDNPTLEALLRSSLTIPAHHSCSTAAMLPREKGGVVSDELRVYGTENLRVVDASVFPLISNTNPMCLVYAVVKKAVDLIKASE